MGGLHGQLWKCEMSVSSERSGCATCCNCEKDAGMAGDVSGVSDVNCV